MKTLKLFLIQRFPVLINLRFLTLCFVLMLTSCKSETEKVNYRGDARQALIDSTIVQFQKELLKVQLDSVFAETKFNGAISVSQNGQTMYEKINGFEDFTNKIPLTHQSVFAIASVSKQFTAVLVLLLQEQGKLSIDDPVSKYLPDFDTSKSQITIKQLLNHTSGISDVGDGLQSQPGAKFHYSNKGYLYLGKIVEQASGKTFNQAATELFAKAGLKHTSTATSYAGDHLAGAFVGNLARFSRVENMPARLASSSISVPAGGILSTVGDLHRWNFQLYGGQILQQSSLSQFLEASAARDHAILGKMGYGLGIMSNTQAPTAYFHSGYVKGSPSLLMYYPATKTSVVILSNIADESKGKKAVFLVHRTVKREVEALERAVEATRRQLLENALP